MNLIVVIIFIINILHLKTDDDDIYLIYNINYTNYSSDYNLHKINYLE